MRWRRWVFEVRAPLDRFAQEWRLALASRGARVDDARVFDFEARAFGSRAFVKLAFAEEGVEAVVKVKSGVFSSPDGLERVLLEAGREAQARFAGADSAK